MRDHARKTLLLLLLILFIGAFLRLWHLDRVPPGLYPDEAMNGNNALEAIRTGDFKVFYPENNGREGLFINIQALSIMLFGNEPWALRIVSALFGMLTIVFTYLFTKELFRNLELGSRNYEGKQNPDSKFIIHNSKTQFWHISQNELIALFAAFFVAVSFWHINFSRIGFRAIMAPFFLTSAFYCAWLLWKDELSQNKKTLAAAIGGVLLGAGFYSYIAYRIMPLLLVFPVFAMLNKKPAEKLKSCDWCAFALLLFFAFATMIPLGLYYLNHPDDFLGRTSQVSIFSSESPATLFIENVARTIGMFWIQGDFNWRHNFSGAPQLWWPQGILFGIGILLAIFGIFKKKNAFPLFFLLSWIALGILPVALSNEGIPHALRAILVIPPVMMLSGYALLGIILFIREWITKKELKYKEYTRQLGRIRRELIILLFLFFLAATMHTFNQYMLRWAHHPDVYDAFSARYRDIGGWILRTPGDIPKYVIVNTQGVPVRTSGSSVTLPMPAQTTMFITDTWSISLQKEKNIYYILPHQIKNILCAPHCAVAMLETDYELGREIQRIIPDIRVSLTPGFLIFEK